MLGDGPILGLSDNEISYFQEQASSSVSFELPACSIENLSEIKQRLATMSILVRQQFAHYLMQEVINCFYF
jgi:hypothetical protein